MGRRSNGVGPGYSDAHGATSNAVQQQLLLESDPGHVEFLSQSLGRNDKEFAALEKLHGQLGQIRQLIVSKYGEVALFPDYFESYAKHNVKGGKNGDESELRTLLQSFRIRLQLRRRLLNRLCRRLNRVAHFMDGEVANVVTPTPPKFGDVPFEDAYDPDKQRDIEDYSKSKARAIDAQKKLHQLRQSLQSDEERYRLDAVVTSVVTSSGVEALDNLLSDKEERAVQKSLDEFGLSRDALLCLRDHDVGYDKLAIVTTKTSTTISHVASSFNQNPDSPDNVGSLQSVNGEMKHTTGNVVIKPATEDADDGERPEYAKITRSNPGIGSTARASAMSFKEKEIEHQRWAQEILSQVVEQPTFDDLGQGLTDPANVFLGEQRRARIAKDLGMKHDTIEKKSPAKGKKEGTLNKKVNEPETTPSSTALSTAVQGIEMKEENADCCQSDGMTDATEKGDSEERKRESSVDKKKQGTSTNDSIDEECSSLRTPANESNNNDKNDNAMEEDICADEVASSALKHEAKADTSASKPELQKQTEAVKEEESMPEEVLASSKIENQGMLGTKEVSKEAGSGHTAQGTKQGNKMNVDSDHTKKEDSNVKASAPCATATTEESQNAKAALSQSKQMESSETNEIQERIKSSELKDVAADVIVTESNPKSGDASESSGTGKPEMMPDRKDLKGPGQDGAPKTEKVAVEQKSSLSQGPSGPEAGNKKRCSGEEATPIVKWGSFKIVSAPTGQTPPTSKPDESRSTEIKDKNKDSALNTVPATGDVEANTQSLANDQSFGEASDGQHDSKELTANDSDTDGANDAKSGDGIDVDVAIDATQDTPATSKIEKEMQADTQKHGGMLDAPLPVDVHNPDFMQGSEEKSDSAVNKSEPRSKERTAAEEGVCKDIEKPKKDDGESEEQIESAPVLDEVDNAKHDKEEVMKIENEGVGVEMCRNDNKNEKFKDDDNKEMKLGEEVKDGKSKGKSEETGNIHVSGEKSEGDKYSLSPTRDTGGSKAQKEIKEKGEIKSPRSPEKAKRTSNNLLVSKLQKKKARLSLQPVPSFAEQDLSRIKAIQSQLIALSVQELARKRVDEATAEYNATVKKSTELQALKIRLQQDIQKLDAATRTKAQKLRSDYSMDVAIARNNWQRQKDDWEATKKARLYARLQGRRSQNGYGLASLEGYRDPCNPYERNVSARSAVLQTFQGLMSNIEQRVRATGARRMTNFTTVDAASEVAQFIGRTGRDQTYPTPAATPNFPFHVDLNLSSFPKFQTPPPPPELDQNFLIKKQEETQNLMLKQIRIVEEKFTASEEERKRAWRKLQKLKSEYEHGSTGSYTQQRSSYNTQSSSSYHHSQSASSRHRQSAAGGGGATSSRASSTRTSTRSTLTDENVAADTPAASMASGNHRSTSPQVASQPVTNSEATAEGYEASRGEDANDLEDQQGSKCAKKYTVEKVRERIFPDGSVKPVTMPKKNEQGMYYRPAGRQRKGMDWDEVNGRWIPISGQQSRVGLSSNVQQQLHNSHNN